MVVQVLGLHRSQVVECLVGTEGVVEVDPAQGLELDVLDTAPGALRPDQLRFEQPDRGLGQGIVVGVVVRRDRRIDPCLDQRNSGGYFEGRAMRVILSTNQLSRNPGAVQMPIPAPW